MLESLSVSPVTVGVVIDGLVNVLFVNVWAVLTSTVTAVLMLNELPVSVSPFPATYDPAPENCAKVISVVPTTTALLVHTYPVSAFVVPCSTNVNAPGNSAGAFMSVERVGAPDAATT